MQTRSSQPMWHAPLQILLFFCFLPAAMLLPAFAAADFSNEVMITAFDGVNGDDFGHSVSIDGDSLLIGAFDNNSTGSAYAYVRNPATDTWSLQHKFNAPPGSGGMDWFGYSVSISGDTALIGVGRDDDQGDNSGSAYVYVRDPATGAWSEQQKLLASDGVAGDFFGNAVSLSGNTAIVGATGNLGSYSKSGSAYVFVRDTATGIWTEQQKLVPNGITATFAGFGTAVFIEGDMAIVGASGEDVTITGSGAAYIFVRDGTDTWNLEQKLLASDPGFNDALGVSVSLNGDTAIVGAPLDSSAYVFVRDSGTGNWTEQQKLHAPASYFGRSVALKGDTAIVGANRAQAAYVYERDTNTGVWTENQILRASVVAGDYGFSMSISGNALVIGARSTAGKGAAFIYTSAVPTYTVGGNVTGLAGSGLVLQNNAGDDLAVSADGSFTFDTALADLSTYVVTVLTQPTSPNQTCSVTNGTGTLAGANVTNVAVTCVTDVVPTYTVGGDVTGLAGSGLVLQNNAGDDLPVIADGSFTFAMALADLSTYVVTVLTQPTSPNQTCSVTNGTGTLAGANVTNVAVTCVTDVVPTYTVGGDVTGLAGSGLVLQNNASDDLPVIADGSFTFDTALVDLSSYVVTVLTEATSPNQICTVTNGTGTLAGADVTNVGVACVLEPEDQTITDFKAIPADGVVEGSSALSATASSGLTVSFGSSTPTVCTVAATTVSYLAAGTCTVTANQAGDAAYNAATQVTLNISVSKADQTISGLTADPASGVIGGTSTLSVSSVAFVASVAHIAQSGQKHPTTKASGIPVLFGSNTLTICTVSGTTVSYLAVGTCTVTADQAGDANYNPAPQVTLDINVTATPPAKPYVPIPTLSLWGLVAMFLMMLGIGGMVVRRKTRR